MTMQSWHIWLQQWLTQLEQRMAIAEFGAIASAEQSLVSLARSADSHR